jgi:chorismate mutase
MAKLTNAQLTLALTNATTERDFLLADRNRLVDEVAALKAAAPAPRQQRAVYVRPHDPTLEAKHTAYVLALMRAREEAVRTGRAVRVL